MAKATTQTTKKEARKQAFLDLDEVAEEAGEQQDFLPYLRLTQSKEIIRPEAIVEFAEARVRMIDYTDEDGEEKSFPAIEVVDEADGAHYTLPCSAGSLQRGLAAIWKTNKSLKGIRVRIRAEYYQHKKHGKTIGYRVIPLGPENKA